MAFTTIRDYIEQIAPPWLRRFWGRRMVGVIQGFMGDASLEAATQGLQGPWLRSGFQPPDALPLVGVERRMPRYPSDTDITYRNRLGEAWDTWIRAGNEFAVIGQLNAFGLSNVQVIPVENTGAYDHAVAVHNPLAGDADYARRPAWRFEEPPRIYHTVTNPNINAGSPAFNQATISGIPGVNDFTATTSTSGPFVVGGKVLIKSGSTTNNNRYIGEITAVTATTIEITEAALALSSYVDENPVGVVVLDGTNWSRFAVVLEQPHPYVSWNYGDPNKFYGSSDASPTYGSTATAGDVRSIKAIIRKWRAVHEVNPKIYVVLSGDYYGDPDAEYGDVGLVYSNGSVIAWNHM